MYRSVKLTTLLHLVPGARMCGDMPSVYRNDIDIIKCDELEENITKVYVINNET
jgi:hypothetical protein